MVSLDDERWSGLKGGYRVPYDPRSALRKLEAGEDPSSVWQELWNELHHQGDVGEASYAAVPHLVRVCDARRELDWNLFALVAVIDIQRQNGKNPPLPAWLNDDYSAAMKRLSELAFQHLPAATDEESVRSMLAVIALGKRLTIHASAILDFSADELRELLPL